MGELTYEDKEVEINALLDRSRGKWQLTALAWIDYDDISQIIRAHIFKKWHLWDQERPFGPWCQRVIAHQISNQIRNNYSNFAKPCLRCKHNMGGDACGLNKSTNQDDSCPDFKKWLEKKKVAYDVKIPVSLDGQETETVYEHNDFINYEDSAANLHEKVMDRLIHQRHKDAYRMLYVEHKSEEYVAEQLQFKEDPSDRKSKRFKQIKNLQKKFYEIAKAVMEEEDILS